MLLLLLLRAIEPNQNFCAVHTILWRTDNPSEHSKPYNPSGVDVSYSTRHVEESWHHLMKSEDTAKFKQIAVCNFDFLLASVSGDSFCVLSNNMCVVLYYGR